MSFPHRAEILDAIAHGASVRMDERTIQARDHIGTFNIRLRIAEDPAIARQDAQALQSAADIRLFLEHLSRAPDAPTRAWFINTQSGERYVLIEDAVSHVPLGCFKKAVQSASSNGTQV
jgi:hypothetical protein